MPAGEDEKLYKIGEVCRMADVQPYVLRYWETEFPPLAPGKSGGGQRLYTKREIDTILRIKELLYSEGFTIAGAKKKLEAELADPVVQNPAPTVASDAKPPRAVKKANGNVAKTIGSVKKELSAILRMLANDER